ncbi:Kef-type K+ transport system membrane component KefB [Mycolicibacterium iranicum]|uniref:Kef-type K+ transport system membrane component KefB n=1 Tax=Mycolicibacterium iranicum TaxID=912594 RepID=A0A839QGA6_MYCIR|nr:cation:proton antiporter [Mycolicibacterium iranicum]MBB2991421.1 Kef-type K+ transport system membrane component KefB [Mycolicibacterium iranicum]
MPSLLSITAHFFLQIAVILVTYRLLWPLFRRLAQVQVVAIMVAGFLLGPSVLGWLWPTGQQWLFPTTLTIGAETIPHPNLTAIYVVGQLGLVLYMFLVGASFKVEILGAHVKQAGVTSAAGIGVPLVLGGAVGWWMVSLGGYFTDKVEHWQGGLFVAAAVAITAFPMLAWIIYDSGLLNTRLGTMALSCAAVDDACSWVLLATVVATAKGSAEGAVLAVGGGLAYLVFMLFVGRRLLARLETWTPPRADTEQAGGIPIAHVSVILLVVLTASWFTDVVGIYSVFGAFVAGAVMPRGALLDKIRDRFEPLVAYLLLPAFFIYSGLNTRLDLILDPATLAMAAVVLVVSFAAKFGAVGLAARSQGMSWYEAGSMGALANARGLMELILLNIGFEAGLISGKLYTILALMTIVTTFVATPLQRLFERRLQRSGAKFGPAGEEPHGLDPEYSGTQPKSGTSG